MMSTATYEFELPRALIVTANDRKHWASDPVATNRAAPELLNAHPRRHTPGATP